MDTTYPKHTRECIIFSFFGLFVFFALFKILYKTQRHRIRFKVQIFPWDLMLQSHAAVQPFRNISLYLIHYTGLYVVDVHLVAGACSPPATGLYRTTWRPSLCLSFSTLSGV